MNGKKLLKNTNKHGIFLIALIDGKHVVLQTLINSRNDHYNYKSQFSIVLMAVADADYKFTFVNTGCQERISDRGFFKNCELYKRMKKNQINLPEPSVLPGREIEVPYVFLGDAAF